MGLFDRLWGSRVPAWGLKLGAKGYHRLMGMVGAELKARGHSFRFGEGGVRVEPASGPAAEVDLRALAARCEGLAPEQWEVEVRRHLDESLGVSAGG